MKKAILLAFVLMLTIVVGCSSEKVTATPDTPEGALQAYFQSLKAKDYEQAYDYLKTAKTKDQFIQEKESSAMSYDDFTIGETNVIGDKATGVVVFETGVEQMPEVSLNAELEKNGDKWFITSLGMGGGMGMPSGMPSDMPSDMPSGMPSGMPSSVPDNTDMSNPSGDGTDETGIDFDQINENAGAVTGDNGEENTSKNAEDNAGEN